MAHGLHATPVAQLESSCERKTYIPATAQQTWDALLSHFSVAHRLPLDIWERARSIRPSDTAEEFVALAIAQMQKINSKELTAEGEQATAAFVRIVAVAFAHSLAQQLSPVAREFREAVWWQAQWGQVGSRQYHYLIAAANYGDERIWQAAKNELYETHGVLVRPADMPYWILSGKFRLQEPYGFFRLIYQFRYGTSDRMKVRRNILRVCRSWQMNGKDQELKFYDRYF